MCCLWMSLSRVRLFATAWAIASQAPLSMEILQARKLEWVATPSSRGSSQLRDQTQVSCTAGRFFNNWPTREALIKLGSIPGLGRSAGEGIGYPLQYLCLPLWLSWWRICLQCGRPGFSPWLGKIPWRRERLPTPVFWPGEFHGLYSPWGHKESDTTEWLIFF